MRESKVEENFRKSIEAEGGAAYKFVSPNHNKVPDRIVLMPIPPKDQGIVAKYFRFVELKAPGKKPDKGQLREHKRLRKLGFTVEVIDE